MRAVALQRKRAASLKEAQALTRRALAAMKDKPEGMDALVRKILEAKPDSLALYLDTLGFVLHRQGRDDHAAQVLRQALKEAPEEDRELLAEIWYHLGLVFSSDAKLRDKCLKKAVEYAPLSKPAREAAELLKDR